MRERVPARRPAHKEKEMEAQKESFNFACEGDITEYEAGLKAFLEGRMSEERFTPFRLQMGVYGQRQDGVQMIRMKLPGGRLHPDQLDVIADIVDRYAGNLDTAKHLHITTRQDLQTHFVKLEDTPTILRTLAGAGVTTREACGNTVRNVTSCFLCGVCPAEYADVNVHARHFADFYLRHPLTQQFPRKFKVAFSGCSTDCALSAMQDIGFIAMVRNGKRGFRVWAAGGLSAQPVSAMELEPFIEEKDVLLVGEALMRMHFKYSDRKQRARARLKYVMLKLGSQGFLEEYRRQRAEVEKTHRTDRGYPEAAWREPTGPLPFYGEPVMEQHDGRKAVLLHLFRGDLTPVQCHAVADAARAGGGNPIRTTPEQGMVITGVPVDRVDKVLGILSAAGLRMEGARGLSDVTTCPGVESCRLAITTSYGLAEALRPELEKLSVDDAGLSRLRVKISGCQHACGQHHIADLGFHGLAKKIEDQLIPHYQLHVGGSGRGGEAYAFATDPVPAKRAPEAGIAVLEAFKESRENGESMHGWAERIGRNGIQSILGPFTSASGEVEGLMYDWSENQPFSTKDNKKGECAAAVIGITDALLCEARYELRVGRAHLDAEFWPEAMRNLKKAGVTASRAFLVEYGETPEDDGQVLTMLASRADGDPDVQKGLASLQSAVMGVDLSDPAPGVTALCKAVEPYVALAGRRFGPVPREKDASGIKAAPSPGTGEGKVPLLDLTGVICPMNFVKTKLRLETLPAGDRLEVILDDGEPIENVPRSLEDQGQKVLNRQRISDAQWKILVEKSA